MIKNIYKRLINRILIKIRTYLFSKSYRCRLEEINLLKNFIIVHCRGISASFKLSFDEIIKDVTILSNFSPKHSAWIGFYYGVYYQQLLKKKRFNWVQFEIDMPSPKKYRLMMLSRKGHVLFSDEEGNKMHDMHPIKIIRNIDLIMQFDPLEACYIGILSGISAAKTLAEKRL